MSSVTRIQIVTYLTGVCLFSICFLVFLNASVSFVVTDLIRQDHGVGDAVGTLGFVDELVALIACPLWGVASDKVGSRNVSSTNPPNRPSFIDSNRFASPAISSSVLR